MNRTDTTSTITNTNSTQTNELEQIISQFEHYRFEVDEPADRLSNWIKQNPGQGWPLFERALGQGGVVGLNAPVELEEFFTLVANVPDWVDYDQLDRACAHIWRLPQVALLGALASMISTYESGDDVMTLYLTGEQTKNTETRVLRTVKWFIEATCPGGLRPGADGFKSTVRVRLIHGFARGHLLGRGDWQADAWGLPINQTSTALGASYVFSQVFVDAAYKCGVVYTEDEQNDIYALWRYVGYLQGVPEELLMQSPKQGRLQTQAMPSVSDGPNEYSKILTKLFIEESKQMDEVLLNVLAPLPAPFEFLLKPNLIPLKYGMARYLSGDDMADKLGMPDSVLKYVLKTIRPSIGLWNNYFAPASGGEVAIKSARSSCQELLTLLDAKTQAAGQTPKSMR